MKKQNPFHLIGYLAILLMIFLVSSGCKEVPPEMKPMIYYSFDDGNGDTVIDGSGNEKHGRLVGSATWSSDGHSGGALLLPGTEGYVRLPNNVIKDMNEMTIALWVKLSANELWSRVFDFSGGKGFMYLTLNAGSPEKHMRFSIYAGNPQTEPILVYPNDTLALGTWTHIAVTSSQTEYSLYIDGQKKVTLPVTHLPMDIGVDELDASYLGKSQFPDPYFNGLLDEFCLYNRALTEEEIIALYEFKNTNS